MFSRASGRDQTAHIVRLFIKRLSAGQKRILLQIAKGELKMMGSEVVYREDKEKDRKSEYKNRKGEKVSGWYLHLTYAQPLEPLNLDARRVATLSPARYDARRPFVLTLPGGKTIGMGDGVPYIKEFERLEVRRKSLHHRYRSGGGKGRGRRRYYQNLKPNARRTPDMQAQFRRRLISFLRRMLERHNCGKLVYREPAMPLRDRMWFGQRNAPFNWSVFEADLKRFCLRHVVKYPKPNSKDNERIGYKEWVANHGEFPKKSGKQAG